MRRVTQREERFECEALRRLAQGQPCQNCFREDGTTVSAHSNSPDHGSGERRKAHDVFVAFLCFWCHAWLDQGRGRDPTGEYAGDRDGKRLMWQSAFERTLLLIWRQGLVIVNPNRRKP